MTDEAMAELRRVCSGERGPDVLPPPPPWVYTEAGLPVPPPPPYRPEVDPFRRNPIGSPNCDVVTPRPMTQAEVLGLAAVIGAVALVFALAALVAFW